MSKIVKIHALANEVEGIAIKAILEDAGIPCIIKDFSDLAYDGIYISQKGWGEIYVFEKDIDTAKELVQEFLKNRGRYEDKEKEKENDKDTNDCCR